MTEVQVGQVYIAKKIFRGNTKDDDPYEIITVRGQSGADPKIGISPLKVPSGIGPNGVFEVLSIKSVMHRKRKSKVPAYWMESSVTVRADIKPLAMLGPEKIAELGYADAPEPEFPSLEDLFK